MRYCPESEVILSSEEGKVVIPLVAVVEEGGGVRIPMSDLFTNFLRHLKSVLINVLLMLLG